MIRICTDLRHLFGPARDQGLRPTCLAFATSDAHAAVRLQPFHPLSVEYLYFHAVEQSTSRDPSAGISIPDARAALTQTGQPIEESWRYLPSLPSDLSTWRPPLVSQLFRRKLKTESSSVSRICELLDGQCPSIVVFLSSTKFYQPSLDGMVDTSAGDLDTCLHAVVACAHGASSGQRVVMVRNSWGPTWGLQGYAWISERYFTSRIKHVVVLN